MDLNDDAAAMRRDGVPRRSRRRTKFSFSRRGTSVTTLSTAMGAADEDDEAAADAVAPATLAKQIYDASFAGDVGALNALLVVAADELGDVAPAAAATTDSFVGGAEPAATTISATAWRNQLGWSAAHVAAANRQVQCLRALLACDASLGRVADSLGHTPLHVAAKWSASGAECVRVLLDFGADCNVAAADGLTPLHCAAMGEDSSAVSALLSAGASATACTADGRTSLHCAARNVGDSSTVTIRKLVEHGSDMEAKQQPGEETPLHVASRSGALAATCELLRLGASPEALTVDGKAPLQLAADDAVRTALRLHAHLPQRWMLQIWGAREATLLDMRGGQSASAAVIGEPGTVTTLRSMPAAAFRLAMWLARPVRGADASVNAGGTPR